MIESFFPHPSCQILSFNMPAHLHTDMFELYPRIMAVLLNSYRKESSQCTYFVHNMTSPAMPSLFEEPLRLITRLFTTRLDSSHIKNRHKRSATSFTNFLMWMSGDTPKRIHNIETQELSHFHMINKLVDQSQVSSLSIDQNSKELDTMFSDLKQDEVQIKDINFYWNSSFEYKLTLRK